KMSKLTEHKVSNIDFYLGQIENTDVVLMKSGIGKVNAAKSTTVMHEKYSPEIIINAGSAGGLKEKHSVGDIIISSEVINHDVDATVFVYVLDATIFDYQRGQVQQMSDRFSTNKTLVELVKYSSKYFNLSFDTGLIGTGDSFIGKPDQAQFIKDFFPEIVAVDMEAAS